MQFLQYLHSIFVNKPEITPQMEANGLRMGFY